MTFLKLVNTEDENKNILNDNRNWEMNTTTHVCISVTRVIKLVIYLFDR